MDFLQVGCAFSSIKDKVIEILSVFILHKNLKVNKNFVFHFTLKVEKLNLNSLSHINSYLQVLISQNPNSISVQTRINDKYS